MVVAGEGDDFVEDAAAHRREVPAFEEGVDLIAAGAIDIDGAEAGEAGHAQPHGSGFGAEGVGWGDLAQGLPCGADVIGRKNGFGAGVKEEAGQTGAEGAPISALLRCGGDGVGEKLGELNTLLRGE